MQVEIPEQVLETKEVSFPTFDLSLFSAEVRAEIARLEAVQPLHQKPLLSKACKTLASPSLTSST